MKKILLMVLGLAGALSWAPRTSVSQSFTFNDVAAPWNLRVASSGGGSDVTSGLIDRWKFDLGSGTSAADSASGNHTGTLNNGVQWGAGHIGTHDTVYDYTMLEYTDVGTVGTGGLSAMTVTAWIKSSADSGSYQNIIGVFDGSTGWLVHVRNSSVPVLILLGDSSAFFYGGPTVTDDTWHHIALVFDGSLTGDSNRLKMYVDGTQITSLTAGGGAIPSTVPTPGSVNCHIGSADGIGRYFYGGIDDVRIYNRALSGAEITTVYNFTE